MLRGVEWGNGEAESPRREGERQRGPGTLQGRPALGCHSGPFRLCLTCLDARVSVTC